MLIPEDYLRIPNGGKVEMRCQVFGPDGNHIYLDWKRSDHRALPEGSTVHNGVLNIPTVDRNAAGEYICLGLDPSGTVLFRAKSHLEIICKQYATVICKNACSRLIRSKEKNQKFILITNLIKLEIILIARKYSLRFISIN